MKKLIKHLEHDKENLQLEVIKSKKIIKNLKKELSSEQSSEEQNSKLSSTKQSSGL